MYDEIHLQYVISTIGLKVVRCYSHLIFKIKDKLKVSKNHQIVYKNIIQNNNPYSFIFESIYKHAITNNALERSKTILQLMYFEPRTKI